MTLYQMNKEARKRAAANQSAQTTSGISDYGKWQSAIQGYNVNRIPQGASLEAASSDAIASLLNPGTAFPDVMRKSAELGASRGVAGSPSSFGTYLRMSDDERLKRIKLGQDMLTQAMGRYPQAEAPPAEATFMTPYQQAQVNLENAQLGIDRSKVNAAKGSSSSRGKTTYFNQPTMVTEPYWWKSPL